MATTYKRKLPVDWKERRIAEVEEQLLTCPGAIADMAWNLHLSRNAFKRWAQIVYKKHGVLDRVSFLTKEIELLRKQVGKRYD